MTIINFFNNLDLSTFLVAALAFCVLLAIIALIASKHFDQVIADRDAAIAAFYVQEAESVQRESMTDIKMYLYARVETTLPMYVTSISAYNEMIMVIQKLANCNRERCVVVLVCVQEKYPSLAHEISAIIDRVELARQG